MQELGPLAPRELLILRRQVLEGDIAPEAVNAMLDTAAQGVVDAADEAQRVSAADAEPPTQRELAEWIVACAPETLAETECRLATLWGLDPRRVHVVGWAFGGLVTWRDGVEFHAPADELLAAATAAASPNPLAALVTAWKSRPVEVPPNLRPDRILMTNIAQVDRQHPRAERLWRLGYAPAVHRRGQLILPGFGDPDSKGPALPLALYGLGDPSGGRPPSMRRRPPLGSPCMPPFFVARNLRPSSIPLE